MKRRARLINIILAIVVIAIVANQALWMVSMYDSYKKEFVMEINQALEKAIFMEITERSEKGGGFFSFALYPENGDTARYIQRTVQTADTTYQITIDRHDPNVNLKIAQSFLGAISPLDMVQLNEIFDREIRRGKFPVQNTYIEYYKLPDHVLMESTEPDILSSSYISSDMIVMNVMKSMGVKAYVDSPTPTIMGRMVFQLLLSVCYF